ncbi:MULTISPECIES: LysR family transcriptional regulator [Pseudovibrio]|uniref:LysR family transcriptional regulator n=1 Tax=Stappiaceae TaxID=2821832 RepID=UPI002364FC32|nr:MULTISPECIES: LysR family transcriptional regulator [Pseudovibrio]MDD7909269.1 LysR family transcriptional regulator [Pseudovibrio exalbescens]MDX5595184.1 LysR family transcriptional regulator [Pseudovibrio sp. SPO723]
MAALNYNHLRYFWAVAHEGNLTRTAERLNISQSALSTQIQKLETQLGHQLFERRGKQLLLTEAGRITLDHADTIFAAGDELLGTLRETGTARQILRVGALATLSRNFQVGFLRPLLAREDVEVISSSGSFADLLKGLEALHLDVALVNQAPAHDSATPWIIHQIAQQHVSLVGTPERVLGKVSVAGLLRDHPVILPPLASSMRAGFDALADRLGVRPKVAAEVDDMAMIRLLAREDVGIAVVPPIVVKDELETGRLIEATQLPDIVETFYAVTISRRFPNPLLRPLLDSPQV